MARAKFSWVAAFFFTQRLVPAKIVFAGTALRSYARLRGNSRGLPAVLAAGALVRAKFWCIVTLVCFLQLRMLAENLRGMTR